MKQNRKFFLAIIIGMVAYCAFILLVNKNTMTQEKVVLLIDSSSRVECREIMIEDCRDECIDYCRDKGSLLFVNSKNQIVERDIAGEEQVMGIEAVDLTETVSNVQYGPFNESIYFIYENKIHQYSLDDKAVTKKTDGIDSTWRRTYIWENDECGYKLVDNGKFSELYSMDMNENLDLRNRIIAIDISNGNIEIIQEIGSWMEGNYLFVCNEDDIFYIQKKGKKEYLYRINLNTGLKEKVYSTRNKVIGLAVN